MVERASDNTLCSGHKTLQRNIIYRTISKGASCICKGIVVFPLCIEFVQMHHRDTIPVTHAIPCRIGCPAVKNQICMCPVKGICLPVLRAVSIEVYLLQPAAVLKACRLNILDSSRDINRPQCIAAGKAALAQCLRRLRQHHCLQSTAGSKCFFA